MSRCASGVVSTSVMASCSDATPLSPQAFSSVAIAEATRLLTGWRPFATV